MSLDLRSLRQRYINGDHIETWELKEAIPLLEQTQQTLNALGAEFRLPGTELIHMTNQMTQWLRSRQNANESWER